MDYRKVKSGMRVKLRDGVNNKIGTIRYVYNDDGYKMFDIIWDGEDRLSNQWCSKDRKRLSFDIEEYKQDFNKMLGDEE